MNAPERRTRTCTERAWCTTDDHTSAGGRRHRSDPVNVPGKRGEVTAWLVERQGEVPQIVVNVWTGTGVTAAIDLDGIEAFRDGLNVLLRQAGR